MQRQNRRHERSRTTVCSAVAPHLMPSPRGWERASTGDLMRSWAALGSIRIQSRRPQQPASAGPPCGSSRPRPSSPAQPPGSPCLHLDSAPASAYPNSHQRPPRSTGSPAQDCPWVQVVAIQAGVVCPETETSKGACRASSLPPEQPMRLPCRPFLV